MLKISKSTSNDYIALRSRFNPIWRNPSIMLSKAVNCDISYSSGNAFHELSHWSAKTPPQVFGWWGDVRRGDSEWLLERGGYGLTMTRSCQLVVERDS
ncbi:hypothetical protein NPIL_121351 [Nephila pilipes]|uniref:Uncharacterized protein n=1 Tax=Nephila pilipes TaxID=299642 RepID=A0A8X6TH52_NEPPI|nr:hypothetical protein NPIL_121351 [Nephila pilipes]